MALFSRRPKKSDDPTAEVRDPEVDAAPAEPDVDDAATPDAGVPDVPISVTTYGSPGTPASLDDQPAPAPQQPAAQPTAPRRARTQLPGLPDNDLLADALAALPPKPAPTELLNVARQLLQGRVYVRVRGDARELIAAGQAIPMAVATINDQKYVLAFSSGEALQAAVRSDGDTSTSAVGVPVLQVLRRVVDGDFGGLALDHASGPAAAVLPRALIERLLPDVDETQTVKSALVGERTEESVAALVEAIRTSPIWIAARKNEDGRIGVSEVRTQAGERMLEVFSHPLELHVLGRGDQSVRITPDQLAKALAGDEELQGVIVNPHGPWMRLSREDLAPLIADAAE
ncbi:SseB family protein [Microbacterium sp. GXF7504]